MAFSLVSSKRSYKPIKYGDGYSKTEFTFDRSINESEFIAFLKDNNFKFIPKTTWYMDYTTVSGNGNTWEYTLVRVYTD